MTAAGLILGTAAYMSPEQAKGREADKRSDVWSFGAVLYEMLTGRRAFGGDDVSDTIASVLKSEPDWSIVPADVPSAVVTLMKGCLVKDRRERVSDMSAARFVLKELSASGATSAASVRPRAYSWREHVLPVAIAIALTAIDRRRRCVDDAAATSPTTTWRASRSRPRARSRPSCSR